MKVRHFKCNKLSLRNSVFQYLTDNVMFTALHKVHIASIYLIKIVHTYIKKSFKNRLYGLYLQIRTYVSFEKNKQLCLNSVQIILKLTWNTCLLIVSEYVISGTSVGPVFALFTDFCNAFRRNLQNDESIIKMLLI